MINIISFLLIALTKINRSNLDTFNQVVILKTQQTNQRKLSSWYQRVSEETSFEGEQNKYQKLHNIYFYMYIFHIFIISSLIKYLVVINNWLGLLKKIFFLKKSKIK